MALPVQGGTYVAEEYPETVIEFDSVKQLHGHAAPVQLPLEPTFTVNKIQLGNPGSTNSTLVGILLPVMVMQS